MAHLIDDTKSRSFTLSEWQGKSLAYTYMNTKEAPYIKRELRHMELQRKKLDAVAPYSRERADGCPQATPASALASATLVTVRVCRTSVSSLEIKLVLSDRQ